MSTEKKVLCSRCLNEMPERLGLHISSISPPGPDSLYLCMPKINVNSVGAPFTCRFAITICLDPILVILYIIWCVWWGIGAHSFIHKLTRLLFIEMSSCCEASTEICSTATSLPYQLCYNIYLQVRHRSNFAMRQSVSGLGMKGIARIPT